MEKNAFDCSAIEKLGKLLTTIGETLESRDPDVADRHFAVLERVSKADDKTLSSRVRFLLLDLLELRDNDWVPRRKSERPQRIGDVHADAAGDLFSSVLIILLAPPCQRHAPSKLTDYHDYCDLVAWL